MENKNTYTIKELVTVTGKDTAAIRKAISRADIEPVDVNGQEKVYSVSDLMNVKSIAKFLNADVPAVEEPVEAEAEPIEAETTEEPAETEAEPETENVEAEAEYEDETPVEESYEDDTESDEPDFVGQTLPADEPDYEDETPVDEDPISDELEADESFIGQTLSSDDEEPTEQAEYESEEFGGVGTEQPELEPEITEESESDEIESDEIECDEIEPEYKEPVTQAQYESEPVPVYYPDTEFNNLLTGTSIYTKIVKPFIELNGINNISTDFLAAALTQLMFTDTSIIEAIAGMHATIDTLLSIAVKLGVVEAPVEAEETPAETTDDAPVEDVAEEPTVESEVVPEDHSEWLDRDESDEGTPALDEIDDAPSEDNTVSEDEVELTDEDIDDNIDVELVQKLTEDMQQAQSGIFNPTTSSEYSTIHLADMPESGSRGLLDSPEPMSANLMRSALMRVQTETETVDEEDTKEDSLDESVSFRQSLFAKLGRK